MYNFTLSSAVNKSYRSACQTTSLYFTFIFTENFPRYRILGRQFSGLILFCKSLIDCLLTCIVFNEKLVTLILDPLC